MAIDLSDLIPSLMREVQPPGSNYFPNAVTAEWLGHLQDGFWEAAMDGVLRGYTEAEGFVSPSSGTIDLSRDLQQVIVFYAGFRIALSAYRTIQTVFRAKAGPVEYETQQSAGVLKDLLAQLATKRNLLLTRLSDIGITDSYLIDGVAQRTDSILFGLTYWTK